jgi:hypothetical protein
MCGYQVARKELQLHALRSRREKPEFTYSGGEGTMVRNVEGKRAV